jgi:hypothetical protein
MEQKCVAEKRASEFQYQIKLLGDKLRDSEFKENELKDQKCVVDTRADEFQSQIELLKGKLRDSESKEYEITEFPDCGSLQDENEECDRSFENFEYDDSSSNQNFSSASYLDEKEEQDEEEGLMLCKEIEGSKNHEP